MFYHTDHIILYAIKMYIHFCFQPSPAPRSASPTPDSLYFRGIQPYSPEHFRGIHPYSPDHFRNMHPYSPDHFRGNQSSPDLPNFGTPSRDYEYIGVPLEPPPLPRNYEVDDEEDSGPTTAEIIANQSQDYIDEKLAEYQATIYMLQGKIMF